MPSTDPFALPENPHLNPTKPSEDRSAGDLRFIRIAVEVISTKHRDIA